MQHPYGFQDTSFKAAGGEAGLTQLVQDFYQIMDQLPEVKTIRAMHPEDLTVSKDKLTKFLCGWLGGPRLFQENYGPISIPGAHAHLSIGSKERDQWLKCMEEALKLQNFAEAFKEYLIGALAKPDRKSVV